MIFKVELKNNYFFQDMGLKAKNLKEDSKIFEKRTSDLVWKLWLKKNLVWVVIVLFLLVVLYLKFF